MKIVTASGWGMPRIDPKHVATRALSSIVEANVHHSDSVPPLHAGCDDAVRGFDSFHRHTRGWAAIGYHRVVCSHGYVYLGRPLNVVPAAAQDHNTPIIAYCLIAMQGKATKAQWTALLEMIEHDAKTIGKDSLRLTTHREVWPYTECPGNAIQGQVSAWRKENGANVVAVPLPHPDPKPPKVIPPFPLKAGHYFGRPSPSAYCHSGYFSAQDRELLVVWQRQMRRRGWAINTDGRFSAKTLLVVKQFQDEKGIKVDGRLGVVTWRAAWAAPVT